MGSRGIVAVGWVSPLFQNKPRGLWLFKIVYPFPLHCSKHSHLPICIETLSYLDWSTAEKPNLLPGAHFCLVNHLPLLPLSWFILGPPRGVVLGSQLCLVFTIPQIGYSWWYLQQVQSSFILSALSACVHDRRTSLSQHGPCLTGLTLQWEDINLFRKGTQANV